MSPNGRIVPPGVGREVARVGECLDRGLVGGLVLGEGGHRDHEEHGQDEEGQGWGFDGHGGLPFELVRGLRSLKFRPGPTGGPQVLGQGMQKVA